VFDIWVQYLLSLHIWNRQLPLFIHCTLCQWRIYSRVPRALRQGIFLRFLSTKTTVQCLKWKICANVWKKQKQNIYWR